MGWSLRRSSRTLSRGRKSISAAWCSCRISILNAPTATGAGAKDLDFIRRLEAVGLARDYRHGTFTGLDHDRSDGHSYDANGALVRSPVSQHNWDLFSARWNECAKDAWRNDGLSS